jgi:hypothetical protein
MVIVILYWNFARKTIVHLANLTFHESDFPQHTDFPDEPDEAFLRPPLDNDDNDDDNDNESDHEEPSHPFQAPSRSTSIDPEGES